MSQSTPFTELFPVRTDKLPKLFACRPTGDAVASARDATNMSRTHGGRWAATDGVLLTDSMPDSIDGYAIDKGYQSGPVALADYVIGALIPPLADPLYQALQTPLQGNFRVLQRPLFKPWLVRGEAALSIGLAHSLIHKQTLADYATSIPDERGLLRMTVMSRSPLADYRLVQGVVTGIAGTVGEHRERLTRFARTKRALKRVENAPDSEPVVQVMTPFGPYQYAASSLFITLSPKDYARLRVDAAEAKKAAYQDIDERARGVAAASGVLKAMDYIGDAYRADKHPKAFLSAGDLQFTANIALGDHTPRPYAPRKLSGQLKEVGAFGLREAAPLRMAVLSALGTAPPDNYDNRLIEAVRELRVDVADVQNVTVPGLSEREIQQAFALFEPADTLIAFLPKAAPSRNSTDDDWSAFRLVKEAGLRAGMISLSLWERDLRTPPEEAALRLAVMHGHAPFALGEPLPFTDFIVGLVYTEAATVALVWNNSGIYVGYILRHGTLDTEGAAKLLPEAFFKGTRVVMQSLKAIPESAANVLQERAASIDVTLYMGTVGAEANPNLYTFARKKVRQPRTGSAFLLAEDDALLVSASPAHPAAPVNPLRVQTPDGLSVVDGMRAVLAMNLMHPTARKPRVPLHLYHSGALRQLLRAGVLPKADEGAFMWWL